VEGAEGVAGEAAVSVAVSIREQRFIVKGDVM
jgi:hypothetical protein